MLMDQDALAFLAARTDEAEESRSEYWEYEVGNFQVAADGTMTGQTALGNVTGKTSPFRQAAHTLLQMPFRRFGAEFGDLSDCERMGRLIAERQNRPYNYDMLRQSFTLALIRNYVDLGGAGECNLVIGDGYGVMTSLLLMMTPRRRTIAANLTKPLLLDLIYIRHALPEVRLALVSDEDEMRAALADDGIRLIAVRADDARIIAEAAVGLAVNMVSMQEMDRPVISKYFRVLRGNKAERTAFYCCNRLFKVTDFGDYPWRENDRVLHDSSCPWSQWYYSVRPPFWHRRRYGEKEVWHRLALLEMDNA